MKTDLKSLLLAFWCLLVPVSAQTQIDWFSSQNATNQTSGGVSMMDGDFRFELGVFNSGFVPTSANIADWVEHWNPAQRTKYNAGLKRYTSSFVVPENVAPFTVGNKAYVWGFRGDPTSGEWVLFSASSWNWPAGGNGVPSFVTWDAKDATAVIGTINPSGSPFLMQSAAVSNLAPPTTSYTQWVTDELSGKTLVAAHEDADSDGIANVLEFIFGTSPIVRNEPSEVSSIVDVSGSNYLQLSVPRRIDRPATVTVQVSSDLGIWLSGSGNSVEVLNTNSGLVVRDLTAMSPADPKRFIRVKVTVP